MTTILHWRNALVVIVLSCVAVGSAAQQPASGSSFKVGNLRLVACAPKLEGAWCGTLRVPLDWEDPATPQLTVGFEFYPARNRTATGTITPIEGGPGYATSDSRSEFLNIYEPLRDNNNLLLFDRRGTGRSSVIKCELLQRFKNGESRFKYLQAVAACGQQLDSSLRFVSGPRKGKFVRASGLYDTANAVRDFNAVLLALRVAPVDLYGDSYGTYFAQVFNTRYPGALRSITLDSSYPVRGLDPWYPTALHTARQAFTPACARSTACAQAGVNTTRDLERLATQLRAAPVSGSYRDPYTGKSVFRTVEVKDLLQLVVAAGSTRSIYRDLGAAARALLEQGDATPLLRLYAENIPHSDSGPYAGFSSGLFAAATCADYAQLYSVSGTRTVRETEFEASISAFAGKRVVAPFTAFAPFTVREWAWMNPGTFDTQPLYTCLAWPALRSAKKFAQEKATSATVPVLVLSGDLDSITTPSDNRAVQAQLGSASRLVTLENTVHVTTYNNPSDCGTRLVREFVRNPHRLATLDIRCSKHVPEVRSVSRFIRSANQATPATPRRTNRASSHALKLAAVAAATAGDALFRYNHVHGEVGVGLRGGVWRKLDSRGDTTLNLELVNARWTLDVGVSGLISADLNSGAVTAALRLGGADRVVVRWNERQRNAVATIDGRVGGRALHADQAAP